MNELIKALEKEAADASQYMKDALAYNDNLDARFWQGYAAAMNNAAALIYGPTPLDGEDN